MVHKIFKSKNDLAIAIPQTAIQQMGLYENSEMSIVIDLEHQRIVLQPAIYTFTLARRNWRWPRCT